MSETMVRETLNLDSLRAAPRSAQSLAVIPPKTFDLEAFHAMEERDNALIADEVLYGALSNKFTYNFSIAGTKVEGVSVIGARHLMHFYGGIKHELLDSIEKVGSRFLFTSYGREGHPTAITLSFLEEFKDEPDFFRVRAQITDVKKGNSIQVQKEELAKEWSAKQKAYYNRPHFRTIAESKVLRNGILTLLPQDVVHKFIIQARELGNEENITEPVIERKRAAMVTYCDNHQIKVNAAAAAVLTMGQINALHSTLTSDGEAAFVAALTRVGCILDGAPAKAAGGKATKKAPEVADTKPQPEPEPEPEPENEGAAAPAAATVPAQAKQPDSPAPEQSADEEMSLD